MNPNSPVFVPISEQRPLPSKAVLVSPRCCPVCSADQPRPVLSLPGFQFFTDEPGQEKRADIHHVQCGRCYGLYMNPCYTQEGFRILFERAAQSYGASVIRKEEQLDWLRTRNLLLPGLTFLDVGCYRGDFLAGLPPEIMGIGVDIDAGVIAEAQRLRGSSRLRFFAADFACFQPDVPVDVITLFHVLEHLPNPTAVLSQLRALAHEGTRLVVEVPVLELGKTNDINGYLTVSHLTHFSVATLAMVMAASGWAIVDSVLQPTYNGYRVVATPCSVSSAEPAGSDLALLYDYLAHYYLSLRDVTLTLDAVASPAQIVLWGAGFHTELVYQQTLLFHKPGNRFLLVDKDPQKQGQTWRGIPIRDPEFLRQVDWSSSHLIISSYGNQEDIATEAAALGVPEGQVHRLYRTIRRY